VAEGIVRSFASLHGSRARTGEPTRCCVIGLKPGLAGSGVIVVPDPRAVGVDVVTRSRACD